MRSRKRKPATGLNRGGPSDFVSGQGHEDTSFHRQSKQIQLTYRILPSGPAVTVTGRAAQTLALLLRTGPQGFTAGEASPLGWARRTSQYIRQLRLNGVPIQTVWESGGDCRIGRYILECPDAVVVERGAGRL